MRVTAILAVLIVFGATSGEAQETLGARVRVTAPGISQGRIIGVLSSMDAAMLIVDTGGRGPVRLPREAVTSLEISQGPSRRGRGALIGLGAGAVAGAVLGASLTEECHRDEFFCLYPKEDQATHIAVGALTLGVVGAAVGALVAHGERWKMVDIGPVRASVGPVRGRGVGARIELSF